jgi:hypothetical protein
MSTHVTTANPDFLDICTGAPSIAIQRTGGTVVAGRDIVLRVYKALPIGVPFHLHARAWLRVREPCPCTDSSVLMEQ